MSLKNLERAVSRLEKKLPPLPGELFPFIDHLIAQHPTLSAELPARPFSAALRARQLDCQPLHQLGRPPRHLSNPCNLGLFNHLLYDDAWSSIRQALDARWPRLRWALAVQDPFYQAQGYHDCLDALACDFWQKSTDAYTYYFTHYTPEEELAIYHQYRQLPTPQRRQYRHDALQDPTLYYDPTPEQRQMLLNIFTELKK